MASENPLGHVVQHPIVQVPANLGVLTPEHKLTILSDHIVMLIVGGFLLSLLVPFLVRRRAGKDALSRLVPTGWANALEAVCQYLRVQAIEPVLHEHTDRFIPYIWSVFYFILTLNLLGQIPLQPFSHYLHLPLGGTATGNIWVCGTLASLTLVMMVVNGLRFGGVDYLKHFNPGPIWLAWLLIPIEIIGTFARIFALAVRLFANMIAGHILLAVLLGLMLSVGAASGLGAGLGVAVPVVAGAVGGMVLRHEAYIGLFR